MSQRRDAAPRGAFLLAGATSASGLAVAHALAGAGHDIIAVSRDADRLASLQTAVPAIRIAAADLTDRGAVSTLHESLLSDGVTVAGIVHLVGGWRQSLAGIADQTDEDWRFLEASLTALRMVTREFDREISADPQGRLITISSTSLARPRATGAAYVALKAAAEAWTLAVADGYEGSSAAATIIAVSGLTGRENDLARLVLDIVRSPASVVNGQRVLLRGPGTTRSGSSS